MNQTYINLTASNQHLSIQGEPLRLASKTVNYVKAHFELGENWDGFDSVRAVWSTDFNKGVPAVLDSLGDCVVPHEVLARAGKVRVNLVGSVSEGDVLTDRLTTCLVSAIEVCCNVPVDGTEPQTITPSQFEQFVEAVRDDADRAETASTEARESATEASESAASASRSASASAESATASEQAKDLAQGYAQNAQISAQTAENAKDDAESARDEIRSMRATATTLAEGSQATANYSNGVLTLGIPRGDTGATGAKGDKGDTGATPNLTIGNVETLEPTESATATITGTAENPVLNLGIPQGDTGEVSLADLSTLLPTDTASGEIASFPDGQSVIPVVSLLADIEPIQEGSGTPSPDNVRPISGRTEVVTQRTGKNLLVSSAIKDNVYIDNRNGAEKPYNGWSASDYAPMDTNTRYKLLRLTNGAYETVTGKDLYWACYDENHDFLTGGIGDGVISQSSSVMYLRVSAPTSYLTKGVLCKDSDMADFATESDYIDGDTYTTDLGRAVYGGKLDVVSGVLTVDRALVEFDGSSDEVWYNNGNVGVYTPKASLPNVKAVAGITITTNEYVQVGYGNAPTVNGTFNWNSSLNALQFRNDNALNATAFRTALAENPLQICYPLAEPQTYQLTPTEVSLLKGQNNVWANSGSVEVVYKADVTKWIEKKLNS